MNFLQVPDHLWRHVAKLSGLQLAILCDAWTWDAGGKPARRSNEQIAEMFGATTRAVTKSVKRLQELGLVEIEYGQNNIRHIKPRTTVHLNERSPRTSVHPEQSFTPASNDRSGEPRTTVHGSIEQSFTLIEHRIEQKEEHEVEQGVVLPWESDDFKRMWSEWKQERKERKTKKYTLRGEQAALHKLQTDSNGDEQTAIAIIQQSIANSWTGLFPLKASKGGRNHNNGQPSITAEEFARVVTKKYW